MTPLEASRILVEFVVWEMRGMDLPAPVKEAAKVCAKSCPRPERKGPSRYPEGHFIVSGFPKDESECIDRRHVHAHQAPELVRELLATGEMHYVLVSDTTEPLDTPL